MTDYQLIRSARRTLSISVDQQGALVVRAPLRMPLAHIEAFIRQKQGWIEAKQAAVRARPQWTLADGAQMPFKGVLLRVMRCAVPHPRVEGDSLLLPLKGDLKARFQKWRKQCAQELLAPRIAYWAQITGCSPASVAYTNAHTRWGSMSSAGALRLNSALVHTPPHLWDYVIVHELCHMCRPDHSPAFHALVRSYLPDADTRRRQLKEYGAVLNMMNEGGK